MTQPNQTKSGIADERKRTAWPVTIVQTRYGGAYEEKPWAAFHYYPEQLGNFCQPFHDGLMHPSIASPFGGDTEAREWWERHRDQIGIGDSPNEAFDDLLVKLDRLAEKIKPWVEWAP